MKHGPASTPSSPRPAARRSGTPAALPVVGFVGLGVMGEPMAGHLARAGYRLRLHDSAPGLARRVADALPGATACATAKAVAARADIVVTMLPNGRVVRAVVDGPRGLAAGLLPGTLLLDCSSAEPWITRDTAARLAAQGVAMVDAPVSGAQWGAQAAELVFMVGAAPADLARVRPLLDAMGRAVFHLGATGAGHTMKCINNTITAMTLAATAEGLALGAQQGLDPAAMTDVLNESTGGSWVSRTHIHQRILSRQFDDPFKLALMNKDIGIAMALAADAEMPLPLSAAGQQQWRAATAAMPADASVSEFVRWIEQQTGTPIAPAAAPAPQRRRRA